MYLCDFLFDSMCKEAILKWGVLSRNLRKQILSFNYRKADDKIFVCKFSKNGKSKLYHTENSKTRGQTV